MKPEEIRYLQLKTGKIVFGKVEEVEVNGRKFWDVTGAYYFREASEGEHFYEQDQKVHNALQVRSNMQPFSQVGGFVQSMRIPDSNVEMELLNMPALVSNSLVHIFQTEQQNAEIRKRLLSRPIPSRGSMEPEDALAMVAQAIEKTGKLPDSGKSVTFTDHTNTIIGRFNMKETSPFRQEAERIKSEATAETLKVRRKKKVEVEASDEKPKTVKRSPRKKKEMVA